MSGQKVISGATVVYAIVGLVAGFIIAWAIGFAYVSVVGSLTIASGWLLSIWLGAVVLIGLLAMSMMPGILKGGVKAAPMAAFMWAMALSFFIVFVVSLFQGLAAFAF